LTDKVSGNDVLRMGFNTAKHSTKAKALSTNNKNVSSILVQLYIYVGE